jgi:hypothetical protein
MAIGKTKQVAEGKVSVIRLKAKDKDGKPITPHMFEISDAPTQEGGEWTVRPKLEDRFNGDLFKVERSEREWEGKAYDVIKLYFKDAEAGETYIFDGRLSSVARNLYLALANLESYDGVSVNVYKSENKKTNKVYTNVSVWQNDKLVKGKYALEDLPKPEVTRNKKGEVIATDYTELDELVKKEVDELSKKVEAAQKNGKKKVAPKAEKPAQPAHTQQDTEDASSEIPF